MGLAFITLFTDQAGEVQIGGPKEKPHFLPRLAAGTGIRRFPGIGMELAAAWAPEPAIGVLSAL